MPQLLINNVKIDPILLSSMSFYIQRMYNNATSFDDDTETDKDIEIHVPGYSDESVAHAYIHRNGIISIRDSVDSDIDKIMLGIYAVRPELIMINGMKLNDDQVEFIMNKYRNVITDNTIIEIYNMIMRIDVKEQIVYYDGKIHVKNKSIAMMFKYIQFMYDDENDKIVQFKHEYVGDVLENAENIRKEEEMLEREAEIEMSKSPKTIKVKKDKEDDSDDEEYNDGKYNVEGLHDVYDPENDNTLDIYDEDIDMNDEEEDEEFNSYRRRYGKNTAITFQYNKHPYNYNEKMKSVNKMDDLFDILKKRTTNIYLNCDIIINTDSKQHMKLIKVVHEIKPDDFASWAIGPKCNSIRFLFYKYPGMPNISSWNVEHLVDCNGLFNNSKVVDCSHLHFYSCLSAEFMFEDCNELLRLPKFYSLKYANSMCDGCIKLVSVDDAILETKALYDISNMFNECKSIQEAFNDCEFNGLYLHQSSTFAGCISLRRALNGCKFKDTYGVDFERIFNGCVLLSSAFNNCKFHDKIVYMNELFNDCDNLEEVFNDCGKIKIDNVNAIRIVCNVSDLAFENTSITL